LKVERARKNSALALNAKLKKEKYLNGLSNKQKVFANLQLRAANKKKIAKYSQEEIQDALALYHRGPAAYRHLRTIHKLPSIKSLQRRLSMCMKTSGPCPVLMDAIKARLNESDEIERVATLCFDGMKLTEAVRFWEHEDR
jgi:hypothetical protein